MGNVGKFPAQVRKYGCFDCGYWPWVKMTFVLEGGYGTGRPLMLGRLSA